MRGSTPVMCEWRWSSPSSSPKNPKETPTSSPSLYAPATKLPAWESARSRLVGAFGSPSSQMRAISREPASSSGSVSSGRTTTPARSAARRAAAAACSRTSGVAAGGSSAVRAIASIVPRGLRVGMVVQHNLRGRTLACDSERAPRGERRESERRWQAAHRSSCDGLRARTPADGRGAPRARRGRVADLVDPAACAACADVADGLAARAARCPGRARRARTGASTCAGGSARRRASCSIGHLDTVWPLGTLARWPFERRRRHAPRARASST